MQYKCEIKEVLKKSRLEEKHLGLDNNNGQLAIFFIFTLIYNLNSHKFDKRKDRL